MDLITLSMPVYNVEPYIERALLSALNQSYPQIEYIVVDDKGNDRSMDIVKNMIIAHPRGNAVRIIEHPTNIGTGATKNTAIDNAQGKYLYFMDSDDEITPDCIQKLYDAMIKNDVDLASGSNHSTNEIPFESASNEVIVKKDKEQMLNLFDFIPTWNKLYKLSFLRTKNIRCVPYHTVEDVYFTFQVAVKAQSYCIIPDITYFHYTRDNSNSGGIWSEKLFKQFPQIFSDQLNLLRKENLDAFLRKKYKKKAFWFRVTISRFALNSSASSFINQFLSFSYLNDKDTFSDTILFLGYIISKMPLWGKILFIRFHHFIYSL
ncbi:glycosyl transferase [Bacteroidia bacterium]|nr:glycosyl transferase [Bacteroidia bacterium]GHT60720.1 glycosyl transferase [Bacteroidia bacterium]